MSETRPNRLIHENSPYLRQHAHNPVDWFPWCDEALGEARHQGRPVLLSIGYSACHWCHVMERESFEDPEIAALMNRLFVNIKVDREERPDLDSIYMSYVQATTGQGGWPLTVFLTPDGVPFYGGTYFPPTDRYGRPGFPTVLHSVSRFFHEQGHRIAESVPEIRRILTQALPDSGSRKADLSLLGEGMDGALRMLDPRHGGFGSAPKFPGSMSLGALLRGWRRWGTASALDGVELSLTAMAEGGIYDHLGGGFHRYSVDERWLVPHFEKMLYDNALLVRLYLEAYQATGKQRYRETAEETLAYVRYCLTSPEGGFYSSEDADSEGEEGRFYLWTREEIERELGEDATVFCDFYGVSTAGNWEGVNILHRRRELEALAREAGQAPADLERQIRRSREHLLSVRNRRERPGLDTKVLASWNGLMVAACAEAGFVLGDERWLEMARRGAEFLRRDLYADDRLWRCRGTAGRLLPAYIEDYAHVAEGLLCLYQASGEPAWLQWAQDLVEQALDQFYDPEAGDFHFTAADHEALLVRPKDYFDNAIPSGNSTMAVNLVLLHHLTGESRFRELAGRLLERAAEAMRRYPTGFGNWQRALGLYLGPTRAFVLVGEAPSRDELVEPLRRAYVPEKVVAMGESGDALPLFEGRVVPEGASVWVCEDQVCLPPVSSRLEFAALLGR